MESLLRPDPLSVALRNANKNSTVLSMSFSTHSYTRTHPSLCTQPVWLPTFKIQYVIAMSPLVIGICLQAVTPESNKNENIRTTLRWLQVKVIIPYWLAMQNLCLSKMRSGWLRFLNCTKEAATQYHVQNILHIQCVPVLLYSQPHFTSRLRSYPTKLHHIEFSQ